MFVAAMLFLVGYWTILSYDHVRDAKLIPFAGTVGVYLLVAHMGTIISPRQIMVQRKTVVVCLVVLLGMCLDCLLVGPLA